MFRSCAAQKEQQDQLQAVESRISKLEEGLNLLELIWRPTFQGYGVAASGGDPVKAEQLSQSLASLFLPEALESRIKELVSREVRSLEEAIGKQLEGDKSQDLALQTHWKTQFDDLSESVFEISQALDLQRARNRAELDTLAGTFSAQKAVLTASVHKIFEALKLRTAELEISVEELREFNEHVPIPQPCATVPRASQPAPPHSESHVAEAPDQKDNSLATLREDDVLEEAVQGELMSMAATRTSAIEEATQFAATKTSSVQEDESVIATDAPSPAALEAAAQEMASEMTQPISSPRVEGLPSADAIREAIQEVSASRNISNGGLSQEEVHTLKQVLKAQAEALSSHEAEISRLKEALGQGGASLSRLIAEERRSAAELEISNNSNSASWLVRDIFSWRQTTPRGKAIDSPPFSLECPGVGLVSGLFFRFFPNGGSNARDDDCCSLYLKHPSEIPWAKYELSVGKTIRGPFDPIFAGTDDFCCLSPNLTEDDQGQPGAVMLGVRFLPVLKGAVAPTSRPSTAGSLSMLPGQLQPKATDLWSSSNRHF
eukprot:TRINITY_DN78577_c0_g1_i1.p1 TRINITY_DN78577_c0_g1~~TRINITY_DN78577_c0_g1_i1.p1  ORF type:complete len:547 (+),score=114.84 TRINITY_DN78577_c0_g1_i1:58-1698(+)